MTPILPDFVHLGFRHRDGPISIDRDEHERQAAPKLLDADPVRHRIRLIPRHRQSHGTEKGIELNGPSKNLSGANLASLLRTASAS
jgi:hypothetical protein